MRGEPELLEARSDIIHRTFNRPTILFKLAAERFGYVNEGINRMVLWRYPGKLLYE